MKPETSMVANFALKFSMNENLSKFITITFTMPSSINVLSKVANLPNGFTKDNTIIIGYNYPLNSSENHSILLQNNAFVIKSDGIYARTSDNEVVGKIGNISLLRFA